MLPGLKVAPAEASLPVNPWRDSPTGAAAMANPRAMARFDFRSMFC
jgi:hypothetical protein